MLSLERALNQAIERSLCLEVEHLRESVGVIEFKVGSSSSTNSYRVLFEERKKVYCSCNHARRRSMARDMVL